MNVKSKSTCRKSNRNFEYNIVRIHTQLATHYEYRMSWTGRTSLTFKQKHAISSEEWRIFNFNVCNQVINIFDLKPNEPQTHAYKLSICLRSATWTMNHSEILFSIPLDNVDELYPRIYHIKRELFSAIKVINNNIVISPSEYWHCLIEMMIQWLRNIIIIDIQWS